MNKVTVLGSGAWGTALAVKLAENVSEVTIWGRNQQVVEQINNHKHPAFSAYPSLKLPTNIQATTDFTKSLNSEGNYLVVVPSTAFTEIVDKLPQDRVQNFCWATKGFCLTTEQLFDQTLAEKKHPYCFITGPSFAHEVVQHKPTAVVIAGNREATEFWINAFKSTSFRPYFNDDIIGSQVGAATKNVIAIAAGICDGLNVGSNAKAALITRGLKEVEKITELLGGQRETVYGLSGLGDIILTATDDHSRNRRLGLALAQQQTVDFLTEGVYAVQFITNLSQKNNIPTPISSAVLQILEHKITPIEAVRQLLEREITVER